LVALWKSIAATRGDVIHFVWGEAMAIPNQIKTLQSAVQSALPDVGQLMQRDAAQCSAMRRGDDQNSGTKPPRGSRSIKPILSPRQLMAISLLLAGRQVKAVAQQLGVDRATVFRWKNDLHFQAEVQRRAELADPVQGRRPRNGFAPRPADPDIDSNRRGGEKSVAELRESNRRLYEKLARESSGRH
jgi:DNA-binding CsgD family transcriptional regulator